MTQTATATEYRATVALYDLLAYIGDGGNASQRLADFEDSFPTSIQSVKLLGDYVKITGEDGSVLHLTVTQVKESNRNA